MVLNVLDRITGGRFAKQQSVENSPQRVDVALLVDLGLFGVEVAHQEVLNFILALVDLAIALQSYFSQLISNLNLLGRKVLFVSGASVKQRQIVHVLLPKRVVAQQSLGVP
jgi:hypothetical protein